MGQAHYQYTYRSTCAIEMADSVIITGGRYSYSRVQEYNLQGSVARLPDLNTGRQDHACGHYVHQGQIVSAELRIGQRTQFNICNVRHIRVL